MQVLPIATASILHSLAYGGWQRLCDAGGNELVAHGAGMKVVEREAVRARVEDVGDRDDDHIVQPVGGALDAIIPLRERRARIRLLAGQDVEGVVETDETDRCRRIQLA